MSHQERLQSYLSPVTRMMQFTSFVDLTVR
jgi:hypothetical protein